MFSKCSLNCTLCSPIKNITVLTASQHKALAFIRQHIACEGYAPSLAEIGNALGIRSRGTVHRHVQALSKAGRIELVPGRKRGIRLAQPNDVDDASSLPLVGRIAAGQPIEAILDQDRLNLADFLLGPDRFALQVVGDSMIEIGILDGDTVIIKRQDNAEDGNIVVALIDNGETTLKRLRQRGDRIELIPANSAYPPLIYPASRVQVQGVLVGQLRTYP